MWGMESNVVFASVRYNWELSRDGFIVCEAPHSARRHFSGALLLICRNIDPRASLNIPQVWKKRFVADDVVDAADVGPGVGGVARNGQKLIRATLKRSRHELL